MIIILYMFLEVELYNTEQLHEYNKHRLLVYGIYWSATTFCANCLNSQRVQKSFSSRGELSLLENMLKSIISNRMKNTVLITAPQDPSLYLHIVISGKTMTDSATY
jgi:hypothetical protein